MNFCPTIAERYVSAMREILQKRVIREGFSKENAERLKKIRLFEIKFLSKNYCRFGDTFSFADSMLSEFFIKTTAKGATVKTRISVAKNVSVNYGAVAAVLGLLCRAAEKGETVSLLFESDDKNITLLSVGIKVDGFIKKVAALADGTSYCELKENKSLFLFPIQKADGAPAQKDFYKETEIFMLFSEDYR